MRGEHLRSVGGKAASGGSSPRAWGTLPIPPWQGRGQRIIPTCVGNTADQTVDIGGITDHPHVRGEHSVYESEGFLISGSSPRAWGTQQSRVALPELTRIIPTCVGNTESFAYSTRAPPDHPHVRGEHDRYRSNHFDGYGSSPRAWGTQEGYVWSGTKYRIIPTCVGNTSSSIRPQTDTSDHPHVRGEHKRIAVQATSNAGSSPRAWGTPRKNADVYLELRIIPTCVGNTSGSAEAVRPAADHPHVRGEHFKIPYRDQGYVGSSPRAWGTPEMIHRVKKSQRIIPTCVGNTHSSPRPQ